MVIARGTSRSSSACSVLVSRAQFAVIQVFLHTSVSQLKDGDTVVDWAFKTKKQNVLEVFAEKLDVSAWTSQVRICCVIYMSFVFIFPQVRYACCGNIGC